MGMNRVIRQKGFLSGCVCALSIDFPVLAHHSCAKFRFQFDMAHSLISGQVLLLLRLSPSFQITPQLSKVRHGTSLYPHDIGVIEVITTLDEPDVRWA